jgi:hypothetical protein
MTRKGFLDPPSDALLRQEQNATLVLARRLRAP